MRRLVAVLGLLGCAAADDTPVAEVVPPDVDRESWNVHLALRQPGLSVHIHAPYVADYLRQQLTRMDSGVTVSFRRDAGTGRCRIQSRRATLHHVEHTMTWADSVRLDAADGVRLEADSLIWDGTGERLRIPGGLRLLTNHGWERGRELVTDVGLDSWTMAWVSGEWKGSGPDGEYRLAIAAKAETGRRDHGFDIVYDSVTVDQEGLQAQGARARLSTRQGVLVFARGIRVTERLNRIQADHARIDLRRQRLEGHGHVVFRALDDSSRPGFELLAARVAHARRERVLMAAGSPLSFVHDGRRLRADSLVFRGGPDEVALYGAVDFRDSVVHLDADTLRYERGAQRLLATGHVRVRSPRMAGVLRGGRLRYDLATSRGTLRQSPSLTRTDTDGSTAVFQAEMMELDMAARTLHAEENVRLRASGADLRADHAWYAEDGGEMLLADAAEFTQQWRDATRRSQVHADTMRARWVGGRITGVALPGTLNAVIYSDAERTSWIRGRDGTLYLEDGRVVRLDLEAEADVTCRDPERNRVTRFTGTELIMEFAAEELRRAWVGGGAEVVWRLLDAAEGEEAALNRVAGEELEMRFDGAHMEVRIGPGVDGEYRPEKRD